MITKSLALPSRLRRQVMVIQDPQIRVNSILGLLQITLIPINDQLQLQDKKKERELTMEEISNHLRHHQVILVVIQTQILVTMMTMTIKEETMAEAEEADVRNITLEDPRFPEIHLPVREAY